MIISEGSGGEEVLGFGVKGVRCRVQILRLRVEGSGFRLFGLWLRGQGLVLDFRVEGEW